MILFDRIKSLAKLITFAPVCELVDAAVLLIPQSKATNRKGKRKLLIIRLDSLGDFILFLDSFKEYRKLYPANGWEITLLGNEAWAELAEKLPYANRNWFLNRKKFLFNPLYRYTMLKKIRKERFDTVIQPTYSREFIFGEAVVRVSGATERIGSSGGLNNMIAWQKKRSDRWYTRLIPALGQPLMELERNVEFIRGLGMLEFKASPPVYQVDLLPNLPKKKPYLFTTPYFVVSPGAGVDGRRWPADRFAMVAKSIYEETNLLPVICGGPGEEALAEKVISLSSMLPWNNLAGKTSLSQLLRILSKAEILVSNETGTVHLAASVGCPIVCIMGGGHFKRFFPYGDLDTNCIVYKMMDCYDCNWWCKYKEARCIQEITADEVMVKIRHILRSKSSSERKKAE